jgi:mannitol/fructose-specific phosphotransferase system IIA component (Ntr-type)
LLKVASVAEEVRRPGRVLPLALTLALVTVTIIYALTVMVTSGVVESETLNGSLTPISDGGRIILGTWGFVAMSICAVLAFVSTANAGIMAASRYLLALSRDQLLPGRIGTVNSRFRTPHVAIGITGLLILLSLLLRLDVLVEAASCVLMVTYMLSCLAVIVLRESGLENYRPSFRAPLYPWLQAGGIVALGFVIIELGVEAYIISAVLILVAFGIFWYFGRHRVKQDSALLHLISRLTNRQLVTETLEEELKEIIRDRDEIVRDRFDRLVENAIVMDLEDQMTKEEFFDLAAGRLAKKLEMTSGELAEVLRAREEESSTLIAPSLAVPHVIVDGSKRFELLIARARQGVTFDEDAQDVKTIFVLAGTRDERNFHLRALAAIAQVVQEKDFEKRWHGAKKEQGLRDVILLSNRNRPGAGDDMV